MRRNMKKLSQSRAIWALCVEKSIKQSCCPVVFRPLMSSERHKLSKNREAGSMDKRLHIIVAMRPNAKVRLCPPDPDLEYFSRQ